jgi:lipid-A-disaccharide synthase-like uncharacterized protein
MKGASIMWLSKNTEIIWLGLGFLGQFFFFLRFFFQWLASEKKKESSIPISFWYLSIAGGIILLLYVIYRKDPVLIVGQAGGLLIYTRNLYFIHRKKK